MMRRKKLTSAQLAQRRAAARRATAAKKAAAKGSVSIRIRQDIADEIDRRRGEQSRSSYLAFMLGFVP